MKGLSLVSIFLGAVLAIWGIVWSMETTALDNSPLLVIIPAIILFVVGFRIAHKNDYFEKR